MLLSLISVIGTAKDTWSQVAIPLDRVNQAAPPIFVFGVAEDHLYVGNLVGLWRLSDDGTKATQIVSPPGIRDRFEERSHGFSTLQGMTDYGYQSRVLGLIEVGSRLFAVTLKGLWVVSQDGVHATKIDQVTGKFDQDSYRARVISQQLIFSTDVGTWIISSDCERVRQLPPGQVRPEVLEDQVWLLRDIPRGFLVSDLYGKPLARLTGSRDDQLRIIYSTNGSFLFMSSHELWVPIHGTKRFGKVEGLTGVISSVHAGGRQMVGWIPEMEGLTGVISSVHNNDSDVFVETSAGLWLVTGLTATKIDGAIGLIWKAITFGPDKLVGSSDHLWLIKDHTPTRVERVEGDISDMTIVGEAAFIGTTKGLWILKKGSVEAERVVEIDGRVNEIAQVGAYVMISTDYKQLWILSPDGRRVKKLESIKERAKLVAASGRYIYILAYPGSEVWQPGLTYHVDTYLAYRLDPNLGVSSQLQAATWWGTLVAGVLPRGWLPSGGASAVACYSYVGSKCEDLPGDTAFQFAMPHSHTMPSEYEFSTSDQFRYELGWGNNTVRYWIKDKWGNKFEQRGSYHGVPTQSFMVSAPFLFSVVFVLCCFALAPRVDFCHLAIMNPWVRRYFSLGSVPLLLSLSPSLRRHVLQRYGDSVACDREFADWNERLVFPDETFEPINLGKKLDRERKLLFTGPSGIGKTSLFKYLTSYYAASPKGIHPAKVLPVYISLINYGGNSIEDLIFTQLFSYGRITDRELASIFLEHGGLLIFLDGINEIQKIVDRQRLGEFVERFWTSNYICLSSQQSYPEIANVPIIELRGLNPSRVREFIQRRLTDHELAQEVIAKLSDEDYRVYSNPRDLEFLIEVVKNGSCSLPRSRTDLYHTVFSSIFESWRNNGHIHAEDILCESSYTMIVEREMSFDVVDSPRFGSITADLFDQKFLVRGEQSYYFRHDLIRSYLASRYFYPRWRTLLKDVGRPIDSTWIDMLKFSVEEIDDSRLVAMLVFTVMEKSIRKDVVKDLFEWLNTAQPEKCASWKTDFYVKYGQLDFT